MFTAKLNQDQISFSSLWEDLRFHCYRGQGHILRYLLNRLRWHYYPGWHRLTDYPEHVDMELSAVCNMQCPMCYTITEEFKSNVKRTLMDGSLWRKIVDECVTGGVFSLRLSLRGEPTLHPEFTAVARYAKEKGIRELSSLTNALKLTPSIFEELVDAGLDWLTISADGIGATYEEIRKPAKFGDLLEKLKVFKEIKRRRRRTKPVIKIQTVWPAIRDNPQEYYQTFRPLVDQVSCNPLIDYLWQDGAKGTIKYIPDYDCHVLYQRLTVGSDGQVLFCLYDEAGHRKLGDLTKQTIHGIWHSQSLNEARRIHARQGGVASYKELCGRCPLTRATETGDIVSMQGREITIKQLIGRDQKVGR